MGMAGLADSAHPTPLELPLLYRVSDAVASYISMDRDYSYGVIPIWWDGEARQYLLVKHHAGHWAFPKGHAEGDETRREAASRELAEETGINEGDCQVLPAPTFTEQYTFRKSDGRLVRKTVIYYIGLVGNTTVRPQEAEVADYAWGDATETRRRGTFAEARDLLDRVEAFLNHNPPLPW